MKRSERLFLQSRSALWLAITLLGAVCCAGTWAVRAWQSHPSGGAVLGFLALTALFAVRYFFLEAVRLFRLHHQEARYEWEREVRPRL